MRLGRVVVLNGTTSAGKSTLATTLQANLGEAGECWIVIGLDDLFAKLPFAWVTYGDHVGAHADQGISFELIDGEVRRRMGPIGRQVMAAYRGAVSSAARAGLDVIVDEVLLSEEDWIGWQVELEGLDVLWVRVDCTLDVVEARERGRGDRMIGLARAQFDVVHLHPTYGLRVDTVADDASTAASLILAALTP